MEHIALSLALFFGLSDLSGPLPSEAYCRARLKEADAHLERIRDRISDIEKLLDFHGGEGWYNDGWGWYKGGTRQGGGTAAHILLPYKHWYEARIPEAARYRDFWWAMWWVKWMHTPTQTYPPEQVAQVILQWRSEAIRLLGEDAFFNWRLVPSVPPEHMQYE